MYKQHYTVELGKVGRGLCAEGGGMPRTARLHCGTLHGGGAAGSEVAGTCSTALGRACHMSGHSTGCARSPPAKLPAPALLRRTSAP